MNGGAQEKQQVAFVHWSLRRIEQVVHERREGRQHHGPETCGREVEETLLETAFSFFFLTCVIPWFFYFYLFIYFVVDFVIH